MSAYIVSVCDITAGMTNQNDLVQHAHIPNSLNA